jgi:hypothetical protein
MVKKISLFLFAALIVASCGNKSNKAVSENKAGNEPAVNVQFASLVENPGSFIDKNISVEGKVVHVCPHTGKKMFIVGENPDIMLYVSAGENTPKFPMELLGSKITVEGRIARAVTAETPAAEPMKMAMGTGACADSMACADSTKMTAGECETETALAKQPALADLMMIYEKHTVIK